MCSDRVADIGCFLFVYLCFGCGSTSFITYDALVTAVVHNFYRGSLCSSVL